MSNTVWSSLSTSRISEAPPSPVFSIPPLCTHSSIHLSFIRLHCGKHNMNSPRRNFSIPLPDRSFQPVCTQSYGHTSISTSPLLRRPRPLPKPRQNTTHDESHSSLQPPPEPFSPPRRPSQPSSPLLDGPASLPGLPLPSLRKIPPPSSFDAIFSAVPPPPAPLAGEPQALPPTRLLPLCSPATAGRCPSFPPSIEKQK